MIESTINKSRSWQRPTYLHKNSSKEEMNVYSRLASMIETTPTASIPWWQAMITGIAAFIIGLLLLISPGMTLLVLVQFLGAYWLATGLLAFVSLCTDRTLWGWKLVSGVLGVIAGLVVLRDPLWSTVLVPAVLVIFLAIDALIIGVTQVIHSFNGGGWGLAILGVLNIIFGLILLLNPLIGARFLPVLLGIFGVVGGGLAAIRAFVSHHQQAPVRPPGALPA